MTPTRRIEKLEAQVASLQARLAARTDQLVLVLLQIDDLKKAIDEAGLEVHPAPLTHLLKPDCALCTGEVVDLTAFDHLP